MASRWSEWPDLFWGFFYSNTSGTTPGPRGLIFTVGRAPRGCGERTDGFYIHPSSTMWLRHLLGLTSPRRESLVPHTIQEIRRTCSTTQLTLKVSGNPIPSVIRSNDYLMNIHLFTTIHVFTIHAGTIFSINMLCLATSITKRHIHFWDAYAPPYAHPKRIFL